MNKNDVFEIEITDMNSLGVGVGKHQDGMVVFVSGAVTGDLVRAKVIKVKPSFVVARLEEVIAPSPDRERDEFCQSPLSCGGCTFRSLKYARELDAKRSFVRGEFIKQGLGDVEILPVAHIDGGERAYRNKAQFPIGSRGGKCIGGFYSKKSHDIIPIKTCSLQPEIFSQILSFVCAFADDAMIAPYDEERGSGILRHLFIRQAKATGEIMLTLVVREPIAKEAAEAFAHAVVERFPMIVSVMENINREKTNVILGDEYRLIYGRDYIEDILLGRRFRISAPSFYQVNHDCAELLYSLAAREAALTGRENLLDLYCGAGTIGLCLADRAKTLVGVEIVPQAIECAKVNAQINGIENAHFFCADASATEKLLESAESSLGALDFDVAVMDPPAKGSTPELINYIAARKIPKVVYVSCGPDTLARDCALFRSLGYEIGAVTPVDMFPRTGHCECVVGLKRKE